MRLRSWQETSHALVIFHDKNEPAPKRGESPYIHGRRIHNRW